MLRRAAAVHLHLSIFKMMIVMLGSTPKGNSRASSFEHPENDCHARFYSEGQQPGIFV